MRAQNHQVFHSPTVITFPPSINGQGPADLTVLNHLLHLQEAGIIAGGMRHAKFDTVSASPLR